MKVEIKDLNQPTRAEIGTMLVWQNDPMLRHLFSVFKGPSEYQEPVSLEQFEREIKDTKSIRYGLYVESALVGEFNFVFDHVAILKKVLKTAWIGIVVGERKLHGHGLGRTAMQYLESQIKLHGGTRIELGVFEFNHAAIRLYESLGYRRFNVIPDFTWWDGRLWTDYRYEKNLS